MSEQQQSKRYTMIAGRRCVIRKLTNEEEYEFARLRARAAIKLRWIADTVYQLSPVVA